MKNTFFIFAMRAFVSMLNFCPVFVVNTEMIEYMEPEMNRKICKLLLNSMCFMALLSYWIASLKKPKVILTTATTKEAILIVCEKCTTWKPERAHHCSICGTCIAKMDHHCPWLGSCVGYHNFKPFFLFCFYQCLSGQVWNYILI